MRVLADYHHHDLWESLELLCARLGWDLYRPIGMEWFDQEYWNFERAFHQDAVARQYLSPWGDDSVDDSGIGLRYDRSHDRWIKLLTLDQARALRPDIVIASVAHNHEGFARFAREVGATFGIQMGNVRWEAWMMNEDRWDLASFGLVTTTLPAIPDKPFVVYHQEFSLESFRHEPPPENDRLVVSSFVNCFAENGPGYRQFRDVAALRPDFDWKVYGAYGSVGEDEYACGNIGVCAQVGDAMRASDIAWHTKRWSDGFGHVIHNWFSVGRPVVGFESYYRSQMAGALWEEGVTSFDLTGMSEEAAGRVLDRLAADPELRLRMGDAAARRFREVVNFDEEEIAIRKMFAEVLP